MKNPGVDFFRTYFQEDFTLNVNFFCTKELASQRTMLPKVTIDPGVKIT
jgi:hypothetical protein